MSVIQRAKFMDKFMTGFFYIVAGFFLLLLLAFTLYVIIKGFANFTPNMFSFTRNGKADIHAIKPPNLFSVLSACLSAAAPPVFYTRPASSKWTVFSAAAPVSRL